MQEDKLTRILQRIHIEAPMEAVYTAWTTSKGLMGWITMDVVLKDAGGAELPSDRPGQPGDRAHFAWHTGVTEDGQFVEANGRDRVRMTFGDGITVMVTLEDAGDSTLMELVQENGKSPEENLDIMLGYGPGWAFYITNLKSVLEGGLDLRDFIHETKGLLNV